MRVLFVCGAGYISGLERVTADLVAALRLRHQVHCLTTTWGDGAFYRATVVSGVPCTRLPLGFISKRLRWDAVLMTLDQGIRLPELVFGWWRLIREFRPDAVLLSNFHHAALLGPFLPRGRCWLHVHNAWPETRFHRRMTRWLAKRLCGFVVVSDFVRARLLALGAPPAQLWRVHNGVVIPDLPIGLPARRTEGRLVVGIAGQVGSWKGHEDLFRAVAAAREREPRIGWCLRVFGVPRGDFADALKRLAADLGVDSSVDWMGFLDDPAEIYGQMDICVVPSRYEEPFGLVAAEAGAWGLPVIVTRRGGLPEIVEDGVTGLLVDAEAPDQIADALLRLARDPALREGLGHAGRQRVIDNFSVGRMAGEIEKILVMPRCGLIRGSVDRT